MLYEYIAFAGGAGGTCSRLAEWGVIVGPVIDLSVSKHFDMRSLIVIEWAIWMIQEGRIGSFSVEPPCTTFSIARHPALRTVAQPRGIKPLEKQT